MEVESNEGTGTEVGDVDWNFTDDDDIREDDVEKDIVEKEDEDTEIRNEELDAEVNDEELMIEDIKGESDEEVIKFDFEIPSDETPYTDTFQEDVVEEDDEDENEAQNEYFLNPITFSMLSLMVWAKTFFFRSSLDCMASNRKYLLNSCGKLALMILFTCCSHCARWAVGVAVPYTKVLPCIFKYTLSTGLPCGFRI